MAWRCKVMAWRQMMYCHDRMSKGLTSETSEIMFCNLLTLTYDLDLRTHPRYQGQCLHQILSFYVIQFSCESAYRQTHTCTHTGGTNSIPSTADAGVNNMYVLWVLCGCFEFHAEKLSLMLQVMHDCRLPSAALREQYGITIENVFDTQVSRWCGISIFDLDLWPRFAKNQHAIPRTHNHAKDHVRRSNGCGRRGCDGWREGKLGNI